MMYLNLDATNEKMLTAYQLLEQSKQLMRHLNDKAHNTAEDHLFLCMLRCVQNCESDYKPPTRYENGGTLLDASYETYFKRRLQR